MASVYRKTATKPLPVGAEIFDRRGKRFARWKDYRGKNRTAPLTTGRGGSDRVVIEAGTYTAKFRDGAGVVVEKTTGCRDITAARQVLADMVRRAELVKANVISAAEDAAADHQPTAFEEHISDYLTHLESEGTSVGHRQNVERCLKRLASVCPELGNTLLDTTL